MMMGPYFELTEQLGIEVVGVEYSGYGMSTGTPSGRNCQADIEAAYDFVVSQGVSPERIVAYGQSVGSGPVVHIASKRQIGGIILHSPMLSGIKVIDPEPDHCCRPSCIYRCFDFFPNDKQMRRLACPGFVIHGQLDDIIPFYHGARLHEATPSDNRWPGYFPRGAGHNDIIEMNAGIYFGEVGSFLRAIAYKAATGAEVIVKPGQDQMEPSPQNNIISAKFGLSGNGAGVKNGQVETTVAALSPQQETMAMMMSPGEGGELAPTSLPYHEPIVGPEDGRYRNIRQNPGCARELQVVVTPESTG
jgi:dienelactone hydrolase